MTVEELGGRTHVGRGCRGLPPDADLARVALTVARGFLNLRLSFLVDTPSHVRNPGPRSH